MFSTPERLVESPGPIPSVAGSTNKAAATAAHTSNAYRSLQPELDRAVHVHQAPMGMVGMDAQLPDYIRYIVDEYFMKQHPTLPVHEVSRSMLTGLVMQKIPYTMPFGKYLPIILLRQLIHYHAEWAFQSGSLLLNWN